jgi:hypothetical protein
VTAGPPEVRGRDSLEIDALVTDRYLESILAAHARGADMAPIPVDRHPDPDVRQAVARLARELPRLHPSFRFEEALAGKLQEAAARMRLPLAAGGEGDASVLAVRGPYLPIAAIDEDDRIRLPGDPRPVIGRPLLVGGALTSAALSIAGAVYVAWRIRHPQASPMARAIRAVARTRLA